MKSIISQNIDLIYMSYRSLYIIYHDNINGLEYTRINKAYILNLGIWPLY